MRVLCLSCGGVYDTVQADGSQYCHACAPIVTVTVDRGGRPQTIDLADLQTADRVITYGTRPRPDARDENVRVVGRDAQGSAIVARKAEGKGTTPAPDATVTR